MTQPFHMGAAAGPHAHAAADTTEAALHARETDAPAACFDDLILGFDPGHQSPPESERGTLQRWISGWQAQLPHGVVLMAHAAEVGVATRRERLRSLRDTVESLGVARENIKYTDMPVGRPLADAGARRPVDAVTLKIIDPLDEAHQVVRTVESCFETPAGRG